MAIQSLHLAATRRTVLKALALAPLGPVLAGSPPAVAAQERAIVFHHTHTGERLQVVYYALGGYLADALGSVNRLLRDFRTGEQHPIDPRLLDTLSALRAACGGGTFEIISGYRSPRTNAMLRRASTGVAQASLHTTGRAIDVRLVGTDTARLRDAAIALGHGGVGYYPESDFVHLDTGRVRTWGPRAG
ncbi:MAG TPA: DUF882 domain-containing protein [Burkholderiales bacterium]|nr:DUF882 domain-containing protein [Burkholderiales bacterium]